MEKTIDENRQGEQLVLKDKTTNTRKLYIESYGCAMNFSDSEIVASILSKEGFNTTSNLEDADLVLVNTYLVLVNTCSIREKAEQTVRKRLEKYNAVKKNNPKMKVGVLGCMAERLKTKFLEEEKIVDLVVGPDAYKDLPNLIAEVDDGRNAVNVILSKEETYGDIAPVRLNTNGITALVSITRGCDNMCTFCVVPFTRGRERSRNPQSIIKEINDLANKGFKEITLLGQQPKMRIRFSTSNPQDMSLEVIKTMANYKNICNHIHLPVQSGSNRILKEMNRQHTREDYIELIKNIKEILPNCSISQDMITGFPSETEKDHQDTIDLMEHVKYSFGYMYAYSERPGTLAERKLEDNIPLTIKKRRLAEIVEIQQKHSLYRTQQFVGKTIEVLIEKVSKKSSEHWSGKTEHNTVVVFPKENYNIGDFVYVKTTDCTSATLIGEAVSYSENN